MARKTAAQVRQEMIDVEAGGEAKPAGKLPDAKPAEQRRNAMGQAVDPAYAFEPVTLERLRQIEDEVRAARAATRQHEDRPAGYFADLGDDSVCMNPECVRPFLAEGKTVYAFTDGRRSGKVACVECACGLHEGIKHAWSQKKAHYKGVDDATLARMTVGEVTDRYGDREKARYEQHGDEQTRGEAGDGLALPRM